MSQWTLQLVAMLPITNNEFLLPWDFTAEEIVLVINPTVPKPSNHVHAGWIRQEILLPNIPQPVNRSFQRVALGYSYFKMDNTYSYEIFFKCFTYLGILELQAYEYI